jgi:hypothetical protein
MQKHNVQFYRKFIYLLTYQREKLAKTHTYYDERSGMNVIG